MPAKSDTSRPLVVALHTWSGDCTIMDPAYPKLAELYDFHFIYPEFRGPNWTPLACGSDAVVSDIVDAAKFVMENYSVDASRVYLTGGSGGGHCSLLVAARAPELWAAIAAWCPISDVARWHDETIGRTDAANYAANIKQTCGGNPALDAAVKANADYRSSITYLEKIADYGLPITINTGIHDGHTGSVPVGQSIRAFNCLAKPGDRFSEECIATLEKTESIPEELRYNGVDPAYGSHAVLLRRCSKNARLSIFEGGHDSLPVAGYEWLARQQKGKPADFAPSSTEYLSVEINKTELTR